MKHPLSSSLGYYSGSSDFDRSGIDNVSADFSSGNVVNASQDFGKTCMSGDFGMDYGEDHYQGGFEGYGHMDHFLGENDEGLGKFRIKKPKITIKSPIKSIKKIATAPIKVAASVAAPLASVTSPLVEQVQKVVSVAKAIPGVSEVQAISQKAIDVVSKTGLPVSAIAPAAAAFLPPKASVAPSYESQEVVEELRDVVTPSQENSMAVTATQARTAIPEIKVNGNLAHPLLFTHRRFKGELMSGFLDDLYKKQKAIVQQAIDTNKAKLTTAATTQASNILGKGLDKLIKSDPKAAAAIQSVVASATETATAKAKEGLSETIKSSFEQNKKYIFAVGGGLLGLIALRMFMKRKA